MKLPLRSFTCQRTALAFLSAFSTFGLAATQAASYSDTVKADNPIAYYRLEETSGTTAADSSASGLYPGTYNVNGAYPQLGQPGIDINSVGLSSSTPSSVTAGYYADFNPQGPFSFEVWARPTSTPSAQCCPIGNFGGWGTAAGYGTGWYVYQTSGGAFVLVSAPSGVWIQTGYSLFNWYHLVGTYDGANFSFYVNGALIGTQAHPAYLANLVNPLGIGQRGDSDQYFDGNLDEVAIYTNALSLARIQAHYQVGTNSFRAPPTGAVVRQEPASTTNYAGHFTQFTVLADGTPTLLYQWFKRGGLVSGATASAYSFICAVADDGAGIQVIVTNNYGSATSQVATLTVSTNLLINAQPTSITRNVGSKAAFEIVAEGALPISYQWYKGASQIQGATQQTLWLSNVPQLDDGSNYSVRVSNPYTFIDSDPATLNVQTRAVNVPVTGYAKVVVADDPVAFWRLDEPEGSSIAVDAVGSFDGAYSVGTGAFTFGVPTGIPHDTNGAVNITGGATVQIPYAIEINPPGAFTVEGWFRPASNTSGGGDYRTALSSMSNPWGAGPTGWLVYQTGANNNWSWWPYNGYWGGVQLDDPDPVVAGQWYYLAQVYDGTTFTFYVNGLAKASGTDPGFVQNGNVPAGSTDYNYNYHENHNAGGSSPMVLGWRSDSGFNPFAGTMDDIAVYNKALTPQQVQSHFLNTVRLSITKAGNEVVLSWPFGTLQSAAVVNGAYTNITGATSPFTNALSQTSTFYRVQTQ